MQLFETMRLEEGKIPRLRYHYERLSQACEDLNFQFDANEWQEEIEGLKSHYPNGVWRLKVLVNDQGEVTSEIAELPTKSRFSAQFQLSQSSVDTSVVMHKTTDRRHLAHDHQTDLILLYRSDGKILEFDIGNVVIEEAGEWYTPADENDLLKGCKRRELLASGQLQIKDYQKEELIEKLRAQRVKVYMINSLREVAEVDIHL
ncbi:aminotransferase class IV [Staphylococcus argensis]|uniref:Aminodeoxychorismate lyase n=1 Tax=Staphylococcus argensis TaxID=1607738 RepID=A0A2K4FEM7_9STAP|nr:aminotransferase class IV [Staphylococcus argensis]MCY6991309.1 aminotransferase class IV [Staphylococcus argensis]POA09385.1 aminodeoxychorismate lyase [Staphylococcus argensis]